MSRTSLAVVSGLLAACGARPASAPLSNQRPGPGPDESIRAVDFLDRTYDASIGEDAVEHVTVHGGAFDRPDDPDGARAGFFHVAPPAYGDVDGDGGLDAVVITVDNTGGTGMFDDARVFAMRGGQAVVIATIGGGDRGDGGLHAATVEPGGVRIERYQSIEGDGACCPSKLAIEHWRWTGKDLSLDDTRTTTIDNPDRPR